MNKSSVSLDLSGKVALITGGTRGIGKAIADKFLAAGAQIIVTGTSATEPEWVKKNDRLASYRQVDFFDEASTRLFIDALQHDTAIDILINNAGVNRVAVNTETTTEDFDFLNTINFKAPYLVTREVSKIMKRNGCGKIVNVTSIWSIISRPGRSIYSATKAAIVGLTRTLAIELAPYNILVNAVGPGFTLTELTASTNTSEELAALAEAVPIKRLAQPEEIANFVLFLSSDLNTYLTGQNIIIDGGYTNV